MARRWGQLKRGTHAVGDQYLVRADGDPPGWIGSFRRKRQSDTGQYLYQQFVYRTIKAGCWQAMLRDGDGEMYAEAPTLAQCIEVARARWATEGD